MSERCRFLIYCIEMYKYAKGALGRQVISLFDRFGVTDYVLDCYEALRTTGEQYIIDDIDRFIANRKREEYNSLA